MQRLFAIFLGSLLLGGPLAAQNAALAPAAAAVDPSPRDLIGRVIENQKKNEHELDFYERIEKAETRKSAGASQPASTRIVRVIPAGTGTGRLPLGPDGQPVDPAAYRSELEKLVKSLAWSTEDGQAQRDAYNRVAKKKKERDDLIDATRSAFLYTFVGREPRGDLMLAKYRMEPNPAFRPTSRFATIFTKVRGFVWVDEASCQLARVEGDVTEDIPIGIFLARVYKGSHFLQERYEVFPGVWLPSFSEYDFDGRKFLSSFSIHERTFYSNYKRIGPPKEALAAIRAELNNSSTPPADP